MWQKHHSVCSLWISSCPRMFTQVYALKPASVQCCTWRTRRRDALNHAALDTKLPCTVLFRSRFVFTEDTELKTASACRWVSLKQATVKLTSAAASGLHWQTCVCVNQWLVVISVSERSSFIPRLVRNTADTATLRLFMCHHRRLKLNWSRKRLDNCQWCFPTQRAPRPQAEWWMSEWPSERGRAAARYWVVRFVEPHVQMRQLWYISSARCLPQKVWDAPEFMLRCCWKSIVVP